jgi:hypothetical protein
VVAARLYVTARRVVTSRALGLSCCLGLGQASAQEAWSRWTVDFKRLQKASAPIALTTKALTGVAV